jgi:phage shock protein A
MSIIQSFTNMFRAHAEELDKSLADPARDGHFAIIDAEKEIQTFSTQLRDQKAKTIELRKQLEDATADVTKYDGISKKAAQAQDGDAVKSALTKKAAAQAKAESLTGMIHANEAIETAAQHHIDDVTGQINAAKNTEEQSKTRIQMASLRENLASSQANLVGGGNALSKINDLAKAADAAEAKAKATEEMASASPEGQDKALEKYASTAAPIDDEAAALMKQFAKPEPATA